MRRKRIEVSRDPAGQLWLLLSIVVAILGAIVEVFRWLLHKWRGYWYRRLFMQLGRAKEIEAPPEAWRQAGRFVSEACAPRQPVMSKRIADATVGDFWALAAWRVLKVVLVVLILIAVAFALRIHDLRQSIAEMESVLK